MSNQLRIILLILINLVWSVSHAALDLELTQGVNSALPIGLVSFSAENIRVPGNQTFSEVIKNDLEHSGRFRIVEGDAQNQPHSVNQVNFNYWRGKGANNLVVGSLVKNALGQYTVSFQLLNVYQQAGSAPQSAVMLSQQFNTTDNNLRRVAHHISDLIYQQLTGIPGVFSTHIAYVLVQRAPSQPARYMLEVADVDGFNPRPLLTSSEPIMSPVWSPDDSAVAYVSFENHRASIYKQTLSTASRVKISDAPGINGAPAFSPDGNQLALVLSVTGNPKIYTLNLQTRQLTPITTGHSIDTEPNWAPDGRSLIFTSDRGGNPQIYRYFFDDHRIDRVTYSGNYNARASFLPDGKSIVMMHREAGDDFTIAQQSLENGRLQVLTSMGRDESPTLAPNGRMILYASRYGDRGVLGMVSIDGGVKLRLPAQEGDVQEPAWSGFR